MIRTKLLIFSVVSLLLFNECGSENGKKKALSDKEKNTENTIQSSGTKDTPVEKNNEIKKEEIIEEAILLNDQNAIPFFFDYQKQNLEDKVRITTRFGNIDLQLFKNTPYHRANFIYLTKKGYFNGTTFHRVVPGFIIQGGNSDRMETAKKREEIGKYLLPPDTRKGYKHHRGVISMPSSEIENPHKLASPYEFFIVQQTPGAYHLDGSYTVFGKVIAGMEVVDEINKQRIDNREAPLTNVIMEVSILQ
ncbi:peptidylprolyl isomerase [Flavobacteriaceae bacterium]|nr:peptidylprolyl isomerase [Flavobacteriaceae bacterium]MDC3330397.1 peptidylprolyl isomerase [Flavobacteriaceae bacterium]